MKGETNTGCPIICDGSAVWIRAATATALRGETIGPLLQLLHECNAVMPSVLDGGITDAECFDIAAQCACLVSDG